MATFWAKIPYRNIVSELDFLKNKIINYARLISRRTSSFEGLKCRGNPPFRSLKDQMSTVQSAVSSLFFWVGTLSKVIKVYHNRNFLPFYTPASPVNHLYALVIPCKPLCTPANPYKPFYTPVPRGRGTSL